MMTKAKEEELAEVHRQRDISYQQFLKEQKDKRRAQEAEKRARKAVRKAEKEAREKEEEQRVACEAEEKAKRELEEYRKMPTFAERVVETRITRHIISIYWWKEVYTAVATGIRAEAQNYYTDGGAKENARKFLKAILLERGIIRKKIEQYVLYFHYNYYSYSYILYT